jgi:hypothetical protein
LKDPAVIQGAMKSLQDEIQPSFEPPEASIEYRKALTQSLLYKVTKQSRLIVVLMVFAVVIYWKEMRNEKYEEMTVCGFDIPL